MEEKKNCSFVVVNLPAVMLRPMLYYCQTEKASSALKLKAPCCLVRILAFCQYRHSPLSGHSSLLFQTELPQSSAAVALPNTNNTMGEAAEFDRFGCNSLHEN